MSSFEVLTKNLNPDHKEALRWFQNNKNREIKGWPKSNSLRYLLASRAKGIYKPKEIKYALSFRSSFASIYEDILEKKINGKFNYKYFQENKDPRKRDLEYTNRAVIECINDVVPVGIIIQTNIKPNNSYLVLGTGVVKKWDRGFFLVKGFDKNGDI